MSRSTRKLVTLNDLRQIFEDGKAHAEACRQGPGFGDPTPRPGDVYLLPSEGSVLVRLVVDTATPEGRWRVVAADDYGYPREGIDVRTTEHDAVELTIRSDRTATVSSATLPADARVGQVSSATLETLRATQRIARGVPSPRSADELLDDTLHEIDAELQSLRERDARAQHRYLEADALIAAPPPIVARPRAVAQFGALCDDMESARLTAEAEANRPAYFVLKIGADDSLHAVTYPRDGVHLQFHGDRAAAPSVRAVYADHELNGEWETSEDDPRVLQTRDAFPWEDGAVELSVGDGYVIRISRRAASRE